MRAAVVLLFVIEKTISSEPPSQLVVPRQMPTNLSRASTSHLDPSQGRLHRQFPSWQVPPFWQVTFLQGSFLQLCSVRAPKSAIANPINPQRLHTAAKVQLFLQTARNRGGCQIVNLFLLFPGERRVWRQDPHSGAQREVPPLPRHYLSTCSLPGLSSKYFPLCFCWAKCRSFSGRARRRAERRTMRRT